MGSYTIVAELCKGADSITIVAPEESSVTFSRSKTTEVSPAYIMASKTVAQEEIAGVTYVESEETIIALAATIQAGSYSASGQAYGVAASNVVKITWKFTDPLDDLQIKFNSMTAKYTNLPTVSAKVTKMEYSASLQPPYGSYTYLGTKTVSNPTAGVSYTKSLNSAYYNLGGDTGYAMLTIYYDNGDSVTYEGSLSKSY